MSDRDGEEGRVETDGGREGRQRRLGRVRVWAASCGWQAWLKGGTRSTGLCVPPFECRARIDAWEPY